LYSQNNIYTPSKISLLTYSTTSRYSSFPVCHHKINIKFREHNTNVHVLPLSGPFGLLLAQIVWFGHPAHASTFPALSLCVPGQSEVSNISYMYNVSKCILKLVANAVDKTDLYIPVHVGSIL